jgi:Fur family peroxide stress response transcriptional regulator
MEKKTSELQIEQFMKRCRENQLKVTPQRLAIYRELAENREHPSADRVYRSIVRTNPTISFDTVNRTLLTFAEIGVIDTVESHSSVRRFDTDLEPHHHLHCIQCGSIIDFYDSSLDALPLPKAAESSKFKVLGRRVVISGICENCRKPAQKN